MSLMQICKNIHMYACIHACTRTFKYVYMYVVGMNVRQQGGSATWRYVVQWKVMLREQCAVLYGSVLQGTVA